MILKDLIAPSFLKYAIKFLLAYCVLYYGTLGIIGLSAPGGYYSSFIQQYLDYPSPFRSSLLHGTRMILSVFGYKSEVEGIYFLKGENGHRIQLVYSCLGFGLMSFWTAFVFANKGKAKTKLIWIMTGIAALWVINVIRLSLLLIADNKNWPVPFGMDHHTLYTMVAYVMILVMMWVYDRNRK